MTRIAAAASAGSRPPLYHRHATELRGLGGGAAARWARPPRGASTQSMPRSGWPARKRAARSLAEAPQGVVEILWPAAVIRPQRPAAGTGRRSISRSSPMILANRSHHGSSSSNERMSTMQNPPTISFDSVNGPSVTDRTPLR